MIGLSFWVSRYFYFNFSMLWTQPKNTENLVFSLGNWEFETLAYLSHIRLAFSLPLPRFSPSSPCVWSLPPSCHLFLSPHDLSHSSLSLENRLQSLLVVGCIWVIRVYVWVYHSLFSLSLGSSLSLSLGGQGWVGYLSLAAALYLSLLPPSQPLSLYMVQ